MKRKEDPIDRAKALVLRRLGEAPWFTGVGVGRVASGVGLVMSVRKGSRQDALEMLAELTLDVEVEIREIGPIKAR